MSNVILVMSVCWVATVLAALYSATIVGRKQHVIDQLLVNSERLKQQLIKVDSDLLICEQKLQKALNEAESLKRYGEGMERINRGLFGTCNAWELDDMCLKNELNKVNAEIEKLMCSRPESKSRDEFTVNSVEKYW